MTAHSGYSARPVGRGLRALSPPVMSVAARVACGKNKAAVGAVSASGNLSILTANAEFGWLCRTAAWHQKGRAMEKGLCYGALGIAALMLLLFALDMVAKVPFGGGKFVTVDVFGIIASGIVGYLALSASKDLK